MSSSLDGAEISTDAWQRGIRSAGPLQVTEAAVLAVRAFGGADRETYVVDGRLRPGDSGGPLLDAQGRVLGLVFAAATDGSTTGFARTWGRRRRRGGTGPGERWTVPVGGLLTRVPRGVVDRVPRGALASGACPGV